MTYFDIQASMHSYKLRCPAFCLIYCRMNVYIIDFIYMGLVELRETRKKQKKKKKTILGTVVYVLFCFGFFFCFIRVPRKSTRQIHL